MDGASRKLQKRDINSYSYIVKLSFVNVINFSSSDANLSCICSTDACRTKARRQAMEEERADLLAAGLMLVECDVQLAFFFSVWTNSEYSGI